MNNKIAIVNVWLAYLCNNRRGKRADVNGRTYRQVVRKFGFKVMSNEFLSSNSWYVKKRIGLV